MSEVFFFNYILLFYLKYVQEDSLFFVNILITKVYAYINRLKFHKSQLNSLQSQYKISNFTIKYIFEKLNSIITF